MMLYLSISCEEVAAEFRVVRPCRKHDICTIFCTKNWLVCW